jgi:DNA polymerase elongation subunit (family B)
VTRPLSLVEQPGFMELMAETKARLQAAVADDTAIVCAPELVRKKGRPRKNPDHATTNKERAKTAREKKSGLRKKYIAILDMETDPFDNKNKQKRVEPFLAVLYSDHFEPIIIWDNCFDNFVNRLIAVILELPEEYTIFAHNGGRFDFMFLIHKMRGAISFKGRGIMDARIGPHHLRDSFHLIPERLAAYQKDAFDYKILKRATREQYREEIIRYCIADCRYLLELVTKFVADFGLKMSIGQAAMCELKKHYEVEKFSDGWDNYIREYFFGGRVECIQGRGNFDGPFKLYDVNSMYPAVMARYQHPIGAMTDYKIRPGVPGEHTVFVDVTCDNNGGLVGRAETGETSARIPHGRFRTTIWEYEIACKYNLISNVKINFSIDCFKRSDFSKFVLPLYENRLLTKESMKALAKQGLETSQAYIELKKDDLFYKFLLNNGYGKFAQNPRRFKKYWITDPDQLPPDSWFSTFKHLPEAEKSQYMLPHFESERYWIWCKPEPSFSFNNVGTAASITGGARAVLLEALQHADNPIYCDTDSIICRDLKHVALDPIKLGAWDIEDNFKSVVITGKKLYAVEHLKPKNRTTEQLEAGIVPEWTIKSKGSSGITALEMLAMLEGETITKTNMGPTLTRYGTQDYLTRKIRATAPLMEN